MRSLLPGFIFIWFLYLFAACQSVSHQDHPPAGDTLSPAMDSLTAIIRLEPDNADLYWKRAGLFLEEKQPDSALSDINRAITLNPANAGYYVRLSDIYLVKGMAKQCREALEKAITLDNQETEAYLKLAELSLYFRDYERVQLYTDEALRIEKGNARAYFIKGFADKEKGDTTGAIRNFRLAVDADQQYYEAYIQLGILFTISGSKLAVDYLNSALNLKPQSIEAMYNLAMYYQETGDYNKAMELYHNILQIDPRYKFAYFNLGYIHLFYLQVYREGVKYFSQAIEADPRYVEAYYNRGYCRELMGDLLNARKDYSQALAMRTAYPLALEGMKRLDQLERSGKR